MLRTLSLVEWEIRSAFSLFSWLFLDPVAALCSGDDPDWRRYTAELRSDQAIEEIAANPIFTAIRRQERASSTTSIAF
jgi:hypothetical protein